MTLLLCTSAANAVKINVFIVAALYGNVTQRLKRKPKFSILKVAIFAVMKKVEIESTVVFCVDRCGRAVFYSSEEDLACQIKNLKYDDPTDIMIYRCNYCVDKLKHATR